MSIAHRVTAPAGFTHAADQRDRSDRIAADLEVSAGDGLSSRAIGSRRPHSACVSEDGFRQESKRGLHDKILDRGLIDALARFRGLID